MVRQKNGSRESQGKIGSAKSRMPLTMKALSQSALLVIRGGDGTSSASGEPSTEPPPPIRG